MILSAARDGKTVDVPAPIEFLLYRWRKDMGVSFQSMLDTPWAQIMQDLEFMDLEARFAPKGVR